MITFGQYDPAETTLEVGGVAYVCRLPLPRVAELQQNRGWQVVWPDGARGVRPKPLGLIWAEHIKRAEYDAEDSQEIILQALIGGEGGTNLETGERVEVDRGKAEWLVGRYVDPVPHEVKWGVAMEILMACCQGFRPTVEPKPDPEGKETAAQSSSS